MCRLLHACMKLLLQLLSRQRTFMSPWDLVQLVLHSGRFLSNERDLFCLGGISLSLH